MGWADRRHPYWARWKYFLKPLNPNVTSGNNRKHQNSAAEGAAAWGSLSSKGSGPVSGILPHLTSTGVNKWSLNRLLHGLGASSRLSCFLFGWKPPPRGRFVAAAVVSQVAQVRASPYVFHSSWVSSLYTPTFLLGNTDNRCLPVGRNLPTCKTLGPMTEQNILSDSGAG